MKLSDAYTILNLPSEATPEEAKKQYKKLAKEFHPDINREPDAEAKFKKINEAYQVIESGEDDTVSSFSGWRGNSINFRDIFRDPFRGGKRQYYGSNIDIETTISFKESVLGTKKEIKYSRQIKCPHCQGSGDRPINNGCKKCGGKGQVAARQQNAVFIQTCPDCMGRAKSEPCSDCSQNGVLNSETIITISIPPAVRDSSILRLAAMGNFNGSLMGLQDTHTDVYVHIHVIPETDMRLEGEDVVSEIKISLLDALRGCDRKVQTIDGLKKITINSMAKNKDQVILSVGDHHNVKHRVIVEVEYPEDVSKIIDILTQEGKIK